MSEVLKQTSCYSFINYTNLIFSAGVMDLTTSEMTLDEH